MPQPKRVAARTTPTATSAVTPTHKPTPIAVPETLMDPFTGQLDVRLIAQIMESRVAKTPEAQLALIDEIVAASTWRRPKIEEPDTPLGQAQALVYDALETDDIVGKEALLRRAVAITEDCVDAWVLLAQDTAPDAETALEFYESGVEAAERVLGDAAFTEHRGQFWVRPETRGYMRARQGMALALWDMREFDDAIAIYQDLLDLNPNDNQHVRYLLITALLERDEDREAGTLLKRYADDLSATWAYSRALLSFRTEGNGRRANASLKDASVVNYIVPDYLLGRLSAPRDLPPELFDDVEGEAITYFWSGIAGWLRTPGAIDWLRERQPT